MDVMEASMLELEMDVQNPKISREFEMIGGETRQTLALLSTTDTREAWNLLSRYQAAARRSYNSAFKALRDLQGDRFNRQPAILPAGQTPGRKEAVPAAPGFPNQPGAARFFRLRSPVSCILPLPPPPPRKHGNTNRTRDRYARGTARRPRGVNRRPIGE